MAGLKALSPGLGSPVPKEELADVRADVPALLTESEQSNISLVASTATLPTVAAGSAASTSTVVSSATATTTMITTPSFAPMVTNHGGPVMEKVMITPIYHGEVPAMAQLNRFYAAVVNSSYIDTLSQYGPITRGTFSQPYIESPAHALPTTKIIDDAVDVQPYIQSLVDRNLIKYTVPNAYHPIHLSPAYTAVTYRGLRSCVGFCGYHSSMTVKHHGKKYRVMYAVFPDPYIPGCACGGGAADDGAVEDLDNLFMMASHELAESITDPANDAVAWSNDGDEVADYCQWQKGSVVGGDGNVWTVQKVWGDRENKCID